MLSSLTDVHSRGSGLHVIVNVGHAQGHDRRPSEPEDDLATDYEDESGVVARRRFSVGDLDRAVVDIRCVMVAHSPARAVVAIG